VSLHCLFHYVATTVIILISTIIGKHVNLQNMFDGKVMPTRKKCCCSDLLFMFNVSFGKLLLQIFFRQK